MNADSGHGYLEARDFKYCPWCGATLQEKDLDGRRRLKCSKCEFIWYRNPVPAAGAIIYNDSGLLLVKRKYPPRAQDWCLPAGFQEYDESPIECCKREIHEETGLEIDIRGLFCTYKAGDDPRTVVVLILYLTDIVGGELAPGDDAEEVEFFKLDSIPNNIAFRAHIKAIDHFRNYLKTGLLPRED